MIRLSLPRLRRSQVTAIQCSYCHEWVKPRYICVPAIVCRRCEKTGANQTWRPTAAHLARAKAEAAHDQAIRTGTYRSRVTANAAARRYQ